MAVIGASPRRGSYGRQYVYRLIEGEFTGRIVPVHPTASEVEGLSVTRSVLEVDPPPDVVVLAVRADLTLPLLEECAEVGAGAAVLLAAGFREMGAEGVQLEEEARLLAQRKGVRLLGPNCIGYFSAPARLNVTGRGPLEQGSLAFLSQSGGVGEVFFHEALRRPLGLRYFVSLGNQADVSFPEAIDYMAGDPDVSCVLLYVEGVPDADAFLESTARVAGRIPVVVLKGGKTPVGARAAFSHTASLAGDAAVWSALLEEAGVQEVGSLTELVHAAEALAALGRTRGRRLMILADGGAYALLLGDAAARDAWDLPAPSPALAPRLKQHLSDWAKPANPLDLAGSLDDDPVTLARVVQLAAGSGEYDAIAVSCIVGGYEVTFGPGYAELDVDLAGALAELSRATSVPLALYTPYLTDDAEALRVLRQGRVLLYGRLEDAVRGLTLARGPLASERERVDPAAVAPSGELLSLVESLRWLERAGVPTVPWEVCPDDAAALRFAVGHSDGIVLKLSAAAASHKSDVGAVRTLLREPGEICSAFGELDRLRSGLGGEIVAMPYLGDAVEAIIGAKRFDAPVPVVLVGRGGTDVELTRQVAVASARSAARAPEALVARAGTLRVLLSGFRGGPELDAASLARAVSALARAILADDRVASVDVNPFMIRPKGLGGVAVDGRVVLRPGG